MSQSLSLSFSLPAAAAASISRPLTGIEQAIREALPTPTGFAPELLALMDGYAFDDHEQVTADKTKLTTQLQGRLVARLNDEAYSFCPRAVCGIIGATAISAETPLQLACKVALIREVTSTTGRGAQRVTQLAEFHALKAKELPLEEVVSGPSSSAELSLFMPREIARAIKQLELKEPKYLLQNDTISLADMFEHSGAVHTFRIALEEIIASINQFSIIDPVGASKLRQDLAAQVQTIYRSHKENYYWTIDIASSSVVDRLANGAASSSLPDQFELQLHTAKWEQLHSSRCWTLAAIHEARMMIGEASFYRSAGHTLSKNEMAPIFERIENKMAAISEGLKQPNPDFDSLIAAVTELSKETQEIRIKLPELPFNDAFEVRERLYQILHNFHSSWPSDRSALSIILDLLDCSTVRAKAAIEAIRNQDTPMTTAQGTEIKNSAAALQQLADRLKDLYTAVKSL